MCLSQELISGIWRLRSKSRRDWGGEPIMVPREQVVAVCEGVLPSFPDADSNPPVVLDDYFDSDSDVAVIRNNHYSLRISEECFEQYEAWMIVGSLVALDYTRLLREYRRLLLGCVPARARSDLPRVGSCGEWYLLVWPATEADPCASWTAPRQDETPPPNSP